jgi:hypothetical protein
MKSTTSKKNIKKKSTSKKACKAVNSKDKCIYYVAEHDMMKAAKGHKKAIENRGGKASIKKKGAKYQLDYSFSKK